MSKLKSHYFSKYIDYESSSLKEKRKRDKKYKYTKQVILRPILLIRTEGKNAYKNAKRYKKQENSKA